MQTTTSNPFDTLSISIRHNRTDEAAVIEVLHGDSVYLKDMAGNDVFIQADPDKAHGVMAEIRQKTAELDDLIRGLLVSLV